MHRSWTCVEVRNRRMRGMAAAAMVLGWLLTATSPALSQTAQDPFPGVSGEPATVYASTISNGKLYIGGQFTEIGYPIGNGGPFDLATSLRQPDFPKIFRLAGGGVVNVVVPDGSGGWYIGGTFDHVGSTAQSNLVHLNADHSVASWNPAPNGNVIAIAVAGSIVYVAGGFTTIGGQSRSLVAAIDAATGLATSWNASPSGFDGGDVTALAAAGSIVYVGGWFTSILGQSRGHIAAIDATTGALTPWNPGFGGRAVYAIIPDGAAVYYGGLSGSTLSQTGMVQAADVAGVPQWTVSVSGPVYALTKVGGTLYAGGSFSTFGGQPRSNLAAVAAASGAVQAWNPAADGAVRALASSGTSVYAGGGFGTIGGSPRRGAAELDATSAVATAWNPDLNGSALALALSPGGVLIGGFYTMAKTTPRSNAAAIDLATGTITGWDPHPNGAVYVMASSGGVIYLGGGFNALNALVRNRIAAVDGITGTPTAWNPNANGLVWALAPSPPVMYVGGVFTTVKGQARNHIAAVDLSSGVPTSWDPDANGNVFGLAVDGTGVYASGGFSAIGGYLRNQAAALDPATGTATWDPNVSGPSSNLVTAIAAANGKVYLSGPFTSAGGQARNHLAALDAATGLATPWNPGPSSWGGYIVIDGNLLYAGLGTVSAQNLGALGALDLTTGSPEPWYPASTGLVNSVSVDGGTVYAVGSFAGMAQSLRLGVAALSPVPVVGVDPEPRPHGVALEQSRPNPSSGRADIPFRLDHPEVVTLEVFDLSGRRVLTPIATTVYPAGTHDVPIMLPRSSVGVFWYRLRAGRFEDTRKLVVVR